MPETASRPMSPPGKNTGWIDVRVGRDDQPPVADAQRRAVVHRRERRCRRRLARRRWPSRKTSSIRRRIARPPAPCFSVMRSSTHSTAPCDLRRSGCPPYWCQMRHVPSLLTMHAPTGVSGTHSRAEQRQSVGDLMPAMMSPQMHSLHERRRRVVPERREVDRRSAGARRGAPTRRAAAGCRSARARCRASGRRSAGTRARAAPARAGCPRA